MESLLLNVLKNMDTQASLPIINKTQAPITPYLYPSPTYGLKEAQYSSIETRYSQDHPQQSSQVQDQGHMEALAETSTGIQETHGLLPHTSTTNTQIIRSGSSTLKVTSTPTMDDNQLFYGSSTTPTLYPSSTMHPALHRENEAASTSTLYPSSTKVQPALQEKKEAASATTPYSSPTLHPAL